MEKTPPAGRKQRGVRQSRQDRNEEVKLSLASSRSRGGAETQNPGGKSSARPRFVSETGVGIANFPKCPNSGSRHEAEAPQDVQLSCQQLAAAIWPPRAGQR